MGIELNNLKHNLYINSEREIRAVGAFSDFPIQCASAKASFLSRQVMHTVMK